MTARNRRKISNPTPNPTRLDRAPESDIRELKRPARAKLKLKLPRDPDAYDPSDPDERGDERGSDSAPPRKRSRGARSNGTGREASARAYSRTWDYKAPAGDTFKKSDTPDLDGATDGAATDGATNDDELDSKSDASSDGLDEVMSYDSDLAVPLETESGFGDPYDQVLTESGLARRPEDLGLQFLRNATQQDNFESMKTTPGSRFLDDELVGPSFSDEALFDETDEDEGEQDAEDAGEQRARTPKDDDERPSSDFRSLRKARKR